MNSTWGSELLSVHPTREKIHGQGDWIWAFLLSIFFLLPLWGRVICVCCHIERDTLGNWSHGDEKQKLHWDESQGSVEPNGKDGWFSVLPPTPGLGQLGEGGN